MNSVRNAFALLALFALLVGATVAYAGECVAAPVYAFESVSVSPLPGYAGEPLTFKARLASGAPSPQSVILKIDGAHFASMSLLGSDYVFGAALEKGLYSYSAIAVFDSNVIESSPSTVVVAEKPLSNPALKVGNETAWSQQGDFNSSAYVSGLEDEINSYLDSCVPDANGYCSVPISVVSSNAGTALLDSLAVYYVTTKEITCEAEATGRKRCSSAGAALEEEWVDANCNYYWKRAQDCNTLTSSLTRSYMCSGNSLLSYLKGNVGSCDANSLSCKATPVSTLDSNTTCLLTQTCDANQERCVDKLAITSVSWSKNYATVGEKVTMTANVSGQTAGKRIAFDVSTGGSTKLGTVYGDVNGSSAKADWNVAYASALAENNTLKFSAYFTDRNTVAMASSSMEVTCILTPTGKRRCSGTMAQSEAIMPTCSISWINSSDCNLLSAPATYSYLCTGINSNSLAKFGKKTDGYCDMNTSTCKSATSYWEDSRVVCLSTQTCDANQARCVDRPRIVSASWSLGTVTAGTRVYMNASTSGIPNAGRLEYKVYYGGVLIGSNYAAVVDNAASAPYDLNYFNYYWLFAPGKTIMFNVYYVNDPQVTGSSAAVPVSCVPFNKGTKMCSADSVLEEWLNADCSVSWKTASNCNALDNNSAPWLVSCATGTNTLINTRDRVDGYCDTSALACGTRTVTDTNIVKQCGTLETCNAASASCKPNTCTPSACPVGYTDKNVTCLSTSCTRQCVGYGSCSPPVCPFGYSDAGTSCSGSVCTKSCTKPGACGTAWTQIFSNTATGTAYNTNAIQKFIATGSLAGNYCYKAQYGAYYSWTKANAGRAASVSYSSRLSDPNNGFSWSFAGTAVGASGSYASPNKTALFSPAAIPCTGYDSCKVTNGASFAAKSNAHLKINYAAGSVKAGAKLAVWRTSWKAAASSTKTCIRPVTTSNQSCSFSSGSAIPPVTNPTVPIETGSVIPPVTSPQGDGNGGPVFGIEWGAGGSG